MGRLYICVTNDEYELPVFVAKTLDELSTMSGMSKSCISEAIKYNRQCNDKKWRFYKIDQ